MFIRLIIIVCISLFSLSACKVANNKVKKILGEPSALGSRNAAGFYKISGLNATVLVKGTDVIYLGEQAAKHLVTLNNHDEFKLAAVVKAVEGRFAGSGISYFFSGDIGHLTFENWHEYRDNVALLNSIQKNTNYDHRGKSSFKIDKWLHEPELHGPSATVYWSFLAHNKASGKPIINAVLLQLGRNGFSKMVWTGTPDQYGSVDNLRAALLQSHRFGWGYKYGDYIPGKKLLADVGVRELIYNILNRKYPLRRDVRH